MSNDTRPSGGHACLAPFGIHCPWDHEGEEAAYDAPLSNEKEGSMSNDTSHDNFTDTEPVTVEGVVMTGAARVGTKDGRVAIIFDDPSPAGEQIKAIEFDPEHAYAVGSELMQAALIARLTTTLEDAGFDVEEVVLDDDTTASVFGQS